MSADKTLPNFRAISGSSVLLYDPEKNRHSQLGGASTSTDVPTLTSSGFTPAISTTSTAPKLIILLTWMSASLRHISKYTDGYRQRYPNSRVLLIRSSPTDIIWYSERTQRERLMGAVSVIERCCRYSSNPTDTTAVPQLLLHVFSNGGSHLAYTLLSTYAQTMVTSFPLHTTIFDSCPGRSTFKRTVIALSASLPTGPAPLRFTLLIWIYVLVSICWAVYVPLQVPDPVERNYRALNEPEIMSSEIGRRYVYSKEDPMVALWDVEAHARTAKERGFAVRMERFEGSGHCAHIMVAGGERYWRVVEEVWKAGQARARQGYRTLTRVGDELKDDACH